MNFPKPTKRGLTQALAIGGLMGVVLGLPALFGFLCFALVLALDGGPEMIGAGVVGFTLTALIAGGGWLIFWHSWQASQERPSRPLRLPPAWTLLAGLVLLIVSGSFLVNTDFAVLLLPPILVIAATLPPVGAVAWFADRRFGRLTWRRGAAAFIGGATISVAIVLILQLLFSTIGLVLVAGFARSLTTALEDLIDALAGQDLAAAVAGPGFIYLFIQVALLTPVFEELAKPLVTLPFIGRLSRRDTFLIGALAGAGFAALENILYAGFGSSLWAGLLLIRAAGGAIHPLGAGLMAVGWRDVWRGQAGAGKNWFIRFGIAVGLHAFWNGGSLLVITLAGARFFGELPPAIDLLGVTTAGTTLALLLILGIAAFWLGRFVAQESALQPPAGRKSEEADFTLSDKAVAVWAVVCLAAIVPAGIAGWQMMIGGN